MRKAPFHALLNQRAEVGVDEARLIHVLGEGQPRHQARHALIQGNAAGGVAVMTAGGRVRGVKKEEDSRRNQE